MTPAEDPGPGHSNLTAELTAMGKIREALSGLPADSIRRILAWARDAYAQVPAPRTVREDTMEAGNGPSSKSDDSHTTATFSEFLGRLDPNTDTDRALVAAYWINVREGKDTLGSQAANNLLKASGFKVKNITRAYLNLMATRPQLIVSVKKAGTSRQARREYKITTAGSAKVERMLAGRTEGDLDS